MRHRFSARFSTRWKAGVFLALPAVLCPVAGAAEVVNPAPAALIVRVYGPDVLRSLFEAAHRTADTIVAAAGLRVEWLECGSRTGNGSPRRCGEPLAADELVLRIVARGPAANAQRAVGLGEAQVDAGARAGSMATVYADRITALAGRAGVDAAALMGRAIAHEIGHLLLGTHHAARGLMRPWWSPRDLRSNRAIDWLFSADEASALSRAFHARVALQLRASPHERAGSFLATRSDR